MTDVKRSGNKNTLKYLKKIFALLLDPASISVTAEDTSGTGNLSFAAVIGTWFMDEDLF